MKITRKDVAKKISDYLQHKITMLELVTWAENMMMEADFESRDFEALREVISRIGLADTKEFGMTWDDCEYFLSRLGYHAHIVVTDTSAMAAAES